MTLGNKRLRKSNTTLTIEYNKYLGTKKRYLVNKTPFNLRAKKAQMRLYRWYGGKRKF